jgi:hypothetical protein
MLEALAVSATMSGAAPTARDWSRLPVDRVFRPV